MRAQYTVAGGFPGIGLETPFLWVFGFSFIGTKFSFDRELSGPFIFYGLKYERCRAAFPALKDAESPHTSDYGTVGIAFHIGKEFPLSL